MRVRIAERKNAVGQRVWFRSIGHNQEKKFRGTIVATYDGKYLVDDGTGRSYRVVTEERLNLQEVPKGEVFA